MFSCLTYRYEEETSQTKTLEIDWTTLKEVKHRNPFEPQNISYKVSKR